MFHYSVFGSCLRSEVALPELRPAAENGARWTLRIAQAPPARECTELLGTGAILDGVDVRLYRVAGAYRLEYDDTGTFDISGKGRHIVWSTGPHPCVDVARIDIFNSVLPIALYAAGAFCLHGSAVSVNGAAIAFVAPSGYGKSTLAIAMTELGARILTDDTLAMESHSPVMASPGIHSVRLLDDSARAIVGDASSLQAVGAYPMTRRDAQRLPADKPAVTKQVLRGLPEHKLMFEPVPLAAVYVLAPTRADGGVAVASRTPLSAVHAALSLVANAKSGFLLGKSEAPVLFDRAVTVAREVPVYQLTVARDLARIAEVAEQIADWHQAPSVARS